MCPQAPCHKPSASLDAAKAGRIRQACHAHDISALVHLATSPSGLVSDDCRRNACRGPTEITAPARCGDQAMLTYSSSLPGPILLGCQPSRADHAPSLGAPPHRDEDQVKVDVDRSFIYYPEGAYAFLSHMTTFPGRDVLLETDILPHRGWTGEGGSQLSSRKADLKAIIISTLRRYPFLNYFQGYHDIAQVILLVLGPDLATSALARLSLLRIRDYLLPSMRATVAHLLVLPCVLRVANPKLERHLSQTLTRPGVGLAAILTLYSHQIEEYSTIARLFDYLLAREASAPIYLFAVVSPCPDLFMKLLSLIHEMQIITSRQDELLGMDTDDPDMLYFLLSKLPQPLDLESLLSRTTALMDQYPPESLPGRAWQDVSAHSVLKTNRNPVASAYRENQDGVTHFAKHAKEIKRQEIFQAAGARVWKNRRPAAAVSLAICIGLLSWYMRRDSTLIPTLMGAISSNLARK